MLLAHSDVPHGCFPQIVTLDHIICRCIVYALSVRQLVLCDQYVMTNILSVSLCEVGVKVAY